MRRLASIAFRGTFVYRLSNYSDNTYNEYDAHSKSHPLTMGVNMPFEIFDKRMSPLAKAPSVTIQQRGVISLNKAAHDLVDDAETVELLYDCDRQVMALRAADDSSPHAYAVRNGSKRGPGQAIVSATAFTQHYGIDTAATRRWKPFVEDGMLCVDLTEGGTVITGNRSRSSDKLSAGAETMKTLDEHEGDNITKSD